MVTEGGCGGGCTCSAGLAAQLGVNSRDLMLSAFGPRELALFSVRLAVSEVW